VIMKEIDPLSLNLFGGSSVTVKGHNRYLIYHMLGRQVVFPNPKRPSRVARGVVTEVCRDIFSNEVLVTMDDSRTFRFKEPVAIVLRSKGDRRELLFLSGGVGRRELSDDDLFDEMKKHYRETMTETLKRVTPGETKETRFLLGEVAVKPRRTFRKRT